MADTKILLVDDEPDVEGMIKLKMRKQIRKGEYEFIFASNGYDALKKLEEHPDIDVVISDINMPEMDGLTLLPKMSNVNPVVKAIMVSAYGDMDNIRSAMNRGAFDFLTKPINFDDLKATLDKTIQTVKEIKETRIQKEKAEKELKNTMAKNFAIVNSAVDSILNTNSQGIIETANPATEKILGYSDEELINNDLKQILPDEIVDEYIINIDHDNYIDLANKESIAKTKDGRIFPIEISISKFDQDDGSHFALIFRDISKRKESEKLLKEYNITLEKEVSARTEELASKNQELSTTIHALKETQQQLVHSERMNAIASTVAGVMHEINNPNAAVAAAIQDTLVTNDQAKDYLLSLLPDEDKESEEIKKIIDMYNIANTTLELASKGTDRIKKIVTTFKEFTKHQEAEIQKTDLREEIQRTIELFNYQFKNVDIHFNSNDYLPLIGNIGEVNQLIHSIMTNSAEAGSSIISITANFNDSLARIEIKMIDNGPGIEEDILNKIFEPFFTTKGSSYSGLGLNLCKRIVEKHNGNIFINSIKGEGTTVEFTLSNLTETIS